MVEKQTKKECASVSTEKDGTSSGMTLGITSTYEVLP